MTTGLRSWLDERPVAGHDYHGCWLRDDEGRQQGTHSKRKEQRYAEGKQSPEGKRARTPGFFSRLLDEQVRMNTCPRN